MRRAGKVRDPYSVQGTLVPLAGAVILMGHRARAGRAWTGAGACSGLSGLGGASTRRPHAHPHPHPRAPERGGHMEPHRCRPTPRVPRPPPHPNAAAPARARAPLGCTVFPRVIARARDTQDLGHQGDRVGSPCARPSVQSAGVVVYGGEEGVGFSQELVLLLQLAHPPGACSIVCVSVILFERIDA